METLDFTKIEGLDDYLKFLMGEITDEEFNALHPISTVEIMGSGVTTAKKQQKTCPRCNGAGRIAAYYHVDRGICFKCGGNKYI